MKIRDVVVGLAIAAVALQVSGAASGGGGGGAPDTDPNPAGRNQQIGKQMAADGYGWTGDQWRCLKALWVNESNWDERAENPSSGAYGIPQSLPANKMGAAGSDWRTNPATQIEWGLNYINDRYGSPCDAWSAWQARDPHWY